MSTTTVEKTLEIGLLAHQVESQLRQLEQAIDHPPETGSRLPYPELQELAARSIPELRGMVDRSRDFNGYDAQRIGGAAWAGLQAASGVWGLALAAQREDVEPPAPVDKLLYQLAGLLDSALYDVHRVLGVED